MITVALALLALGAPPDDDRLVLASASYGKNVIAICEPDGKVLWSHKTGGPKRGHTGHHDLKLLDNGNILYHDSWTVTKELTLDKKEVWSYDSAKQNGNEGKRVHVHAFGRLPNGHTWIAESGVGRIIEVDRDGMIHATVTLGGDGRQNTRQVERLPNGNYLACAEKPGVVTEYNAESEIVWEYPINTRVYGAIRLKSGNTLIASGSGNSVVEVTPDKKVVWEVTGRVPGTELDLKWTTCLTEMANGNYVVGNCHAGPNNPQIFEITRDKKVVWEFNEFDLFGNGLACSEILDAGRSKQVRAKLAEIGGK